MFVRANHVPYMTKVLRRAIMKRSQIESNTLKILTLKIEINTKNKRIFAVSYTKRNLRNLIRI